MADATVRLIAYLVVAGTVRRREACVRGGRQPCRAHMRDRDRRYSRRRKRFPTVRRLRGRNWTDGDRRRLEHDLGFGIGLAHGYATLGTICFHFDYAAIGTVSNVASHLCDEAQPGQILISPRVLLAVEGAVSVEPVAEMSLKGIRRPSQVHNVVGAKQ